jgi:hypothetical protein
VNQFYTKSLHLQYTHHTSLNENRFHAVAIFTENIRVSCLKKVKILVERVGIELPPAIPFGLAILRITNYTTGAA